MGWIRRTLKKGFHKIENTLKRLDSSLMAKRAAVKSAALWLKGKLRKEDKRGDIRESLRRLAARASWPKSTMEKFYQQEILPLAGDDAELKHYMVVQGLRALPKVARNGAAGHDFFAGLLDTAKKGNFWLKCWFVVEGVEALPALVKADPPLAEKLVKGMLQIAGDNPDLKRRVYGAAVDVLPVLAAYDNRLKPVMPSWVSDLRTAVGDDPKQPVIYKELALSPVNPASSHATLVIATGGRFDELRVFSGCFAGLSSDFARAVDKKYPYNSKTPGRAHYEAVMNFIRNGSEIMSKTPSLRAALIAKASGAAPVTGAAWPVKKAV